MRFGNDFRYATTAKRYPNPAATSFFFFHVYNIVNNTIKQSFVCLCHVLSCIYVSYRVRKIFLKQFQHIMFVEIFLPIVLSKTSSHPSFNASFAKRKIDKSNVFSFLALFVRLFVCKCTHTHTTSSQQINGQK